MDKQEEPVQVFQCPKCSCYFIDAEKTYTRLLDLDACKSVTIKCECKHVFEITKNYTGKISVFRTNAVNQWDALIKHNINIEQKALSRTN